MIYKYMHNPPGIYNYTIICNFLLPQYMLYTAPLLCLITYAYVCRVHVHVLTGNTAVFSTPLSQFISVLCMT